MHKWYYNYAGLQVVSDLELPEWGSFQHAGGLDDTDVSIRLDIATGSDLSAIVPESVITANEYRFFMPEVGAYRVVAGKEIIIFPVAAAGQNELRLFLLGTAWGALCYQRGLLSVHASAVQVGNEAVLFCASQGKGKSTMTACLAAIGHALVSDDLCCLNTPTLAQPTVYPSTQRLRLWHDALEALGWNCDQLERDHYRFDKFLLPWTGKPLLHPLPLRAIYLLEWGDYKLQRLTGMTALQRFVSAATYRGELLQQMGLSGLYWQRCLQLLQKVPVWELTRQKDLTKLSNIATMLEQHWACSTELHDI